MFGSLKYNQGTAANMSVESADAMTMAQRNHLFDKPGGGARAEARAAPRAAQRATRSATPTSTGAGGWRLEVL